jgi:hypothetical protein
LSHSIVTENDGKRADHDFSIIVPDNGTGKTDTGVKILAADSVTIEGVHEREQMGGDAAAAHEDVT